MVAAFQSAGSFLKQDSSFISISQDEEEERIEEGSRKQIQLNTREINKSHWPVTAREALGRNDHYFTPGLEIKLDPFICIL